MKGTRLSKSPFIQSKDYPRVSVANGADPYGNTIKALSAFDLSPARGKRVLLKPNAGRNAKPEDGVVTNPLVVAAAIDVFQKAGAEVAVGESPIVGVKALEALESSGIAGEARKRGCPLIDMDERPFVKLEVPEGKAILSLKVCPEVFEFDIIVSIPVMKTHMHTGVTLAIKNMKGCLWRRSKTTLHMLPLVEGDENKPLNIAIADLSGVLSPHFAIIDGTICMEGLGPSSGKPKPLGVVLAGADPFAADAVACELMGLHAKDIPHLQIGAERGYGIIDLDRVSVTPENWRETASVFDTPPDNLSIEFPGMTILDQNSCSACQSTLLLFLKRYGKQVLDYFPDSNVDIAIGKGHDVLPQNTICIGNCTARHKEGNIFVPGCPPVASEILRTITNDEIDPGETE
ncbi:MAG: DUF362 domain-containing protein [bacterium]|nr:DUF362 domain-containing protein [bacterium]